MKQIFLFISLAIIGAGLYLKFFYDIPDSQATVNFFMSGFLVIVGTSSLLMNIFWSNPKRNK